MLDIIHNIVCTNMKKHRLGTITDRSNKFKYIHVQTNNTFIAASGQRRVTNNQAAESALPVWSSLDLGFNRKQVEFLSQTDFGFRNLGRYLSSTSSSDCLTDVTVDFHQNGYDVLSG